MQVVVRHHAERLGQQHGCLRLVAVNPSDDEGSLLRIPVAVPPLKRSPSHAPPIDGRFPVGHAARTNRPQFVGHRSFLTVRTAVKSTNTALSAIANAVLSALIVPITPAASSSRSAEISLAISD